MDRQNCDRALKHPHHNEAFLAALSWAGLSLLLSAVLLVLGYLIYSPSVANLRQGVLTGSSPQSVPGAALEMRLGSGHKTAEKALAITAVEHGQDSRAIATKRANVSAAAFPLMEFRLSGHHPEAHVYLIWRTARYPERMFNIPVPLVDGGAGTMRPGGHEGWAGLITEIGFDVYGELREPLLIESFSLLPWSWSGTIRSVLQDWTSFRSWTLRSINFLRAVHSPGGLSPVVAMAAWAGSACLLLTLGLLAAWPPRPLAFLFAVLVPWLAIDLMWTSSLARQLEETRYLFAGKTQEQKHLVDRESELYQYAVHLKEKVLPGPGERIFLLHDSPHLTFKRVRAQYYLLPHNIYNYDRFPRPEFSVPGDYVLVLGDVQGLVFEGEALHWHGQSLSVEAIDQHPMGSVYRVVEGAR